MKRISITERVTLEPIYLNKNYKNYLKQEIVKKSQGKCTKENGYIINICDILTIKECESQSGIVFAVTYTADSFLPKIDDIIETKVCLCFASGILAIYKDVHKILIPANKLTNYTFTNNSYVSKNNKIQVNTEISIKITSVKFSEGVFQSTGVLNE